MVVMAVPVMAAAQSPPVPRVEFGAQVSRQTGERSSITGTPRITWNVTPLTAIEMGVDLRRALPVEFGSRTNSEALNLHVRQSLWSDDRWQVFGLMGLGVVHATTIFEGGSFEFVETSPTVHVGSAVQFRATPWLDVRADLRLTLSEESGVRGMVGTVIPIGRLPVRRPEGTTRTRDSLANGIITGGLTGAVGVGALYGYFGRAFCERDDCDAFTAKTAAFGAVSGAIVGGLVGAVVDSLITKR
jgi:hypothetical protein